MTAVFRGAALATRAEHASSRHSSKRRGSTCDEDNTRVLAARIDEPYFDAMGLQRLHLLPVPADEAAPDDHDRLRLLLRQGLTLAVAGLVVGLVASAAAGRLLQSAFLTGQDQRDIVGVLLVVPIVLVVTLLATYVPAFQASRVNPIQALRHD